MSHEQSILLYGNLALCDGWYTLVNDDVWCTYVYGMCLVYDISWVMETGRRMLDDG